MASESYEDKWVFFVFLANKYMFKINNRNNRKIKNNRKFCARYVKCH